MKCESCIYFNVVENAIADVNEIIKFYCEDTY